MAWIAIKNFFVSELYIITITLLYLSIYFYFRFKIKKEERSRLKSIKKRNIRDAVETDSPLEDQAKVLKEKGMELTHARFSFIQKALPLTLFILWSIFVFLPYLGKLPPVYVSIVAAVLSVILGVALRPFLENLFSGVVISFFKSIRIGDTVVIDDHYGIIEEIGLTYSVLKQWDWNRIVIPNSKLLQKEIQNLTMHDHNLWAHIEFFVGPETDLALLEEMATRVAKKSKHFDNVEEPSFWVMDLQKDSIKCWLAAWASTPSNAWELRNEMRTNLLKVLQQQKIHFHKHYIVS